MYQKFGMVFHIVSLPSTVLWPQIGPLYQPIMVDECGAKGGNDKQGQTIVLRDKPTPELLYPPQIQCGLL